MTRDQNGQPVSSDVRREGDGTWGATVWWGSSPATVIRRYFYRTRAQARLADIADAPGDGSGRVE